MDKISKSWVALKIHQRELSNQSIAQWFAEEDVLPINRAKRLTLQLGDLYVDFSRQLIRRDTLGLLVDLAQSRDFLAKRLALFRGEPINVTENRAAWHTLLRANLTDRPEKELFDVHANLAKMRNLVNHFNAGQFTDVINIGIGGSDLGPRMVFEALANLNEHRPYRRVHFLSNIDGSQLQELLAGLVPAKTLVIVCSKTFTTYETLLNANAIRQWFIDHGAKDLIDNQWIGVTAHTNAATEWGIAVDRVLALWDWVGGRYSVWSSVGLSIALGLGFDIFEQLLAGARAMDKHFEKAPLEKNIPFVMGCLQVWYASFWQYCTHMVVPYHQRLALFGVYLQQLEMESNGKSVSMSGHPLPYTTTPALLPQVGTDAQHAVFQWLHQSTIVTPVDFVVVLETSQRYPDHQRGLVANAFAQSIALADGLDDQALHSKGIPMAAVPHRTHSGNRPSSLFVLPRLDAYNLGVLMAAYEHKVFTASVLWDINPFDQFGVEYGKQVGRQLLESDFRATDSGKKQLIQWLKDILK